MGWVCLHREVTVLLDMCVSVVAPLMRWQKLLYHTFGVISLAAQINTFIVVERRFHRQWIRIAKSLLAIRNRGFGPLYR